MDFIFSMFSIVIILFQLYELKCLLAWLFVDTPKDFSDSKLDELLDFLIGRRHLRVFSNQFNLSQFDLQCLIIFWFSIPVLLMGNSYLVLAQLLILQIALIVFLVYQIFWIAGMVGEKIAFLKGQLHEAKKDNDTFKKQRILKLLKDLSVYDYVTNFIAKFITIIIIVSFVYAIIYFNLTQIFVSSFESLSSDTIFFEYLYRSTLITLTLDQISPNHVFSKIVFVLHGFSNIYLFALLISLFLTVSEKEIDDLKDIIDIEADETT